jgi:hypothetical protein
MTCTKVRKNLPLLAGGDLPARRARKLFAHIEACPGCRDELEEYRSALARLKVVARETGADDWTEGEWKALMARAAGQRAGGEEAGWFDRRPRWAWVPGLAALLLVAVLAFLFREPIFRSRGTGPGQGPAVFKKEESRAAPLKLPSSKPAGEKGQRVPVIQPEYFAKNADAKVPSAGSPAKGAAGQDVISVTLVSRETGLQVVWLFNRNFEWKGDRK